MEVKNMKELKNYADMVAEAIEVLKSDDNIFACCCEELDSWDGFLGDDRAYSMCELDELHCGLKASDFIARLTKDFNINDDYFYYSIYGLESFSGSLADHYKDVTSEEKVFDEIIKNYSRLDIKWIDAYFDSLLQDIINYSED